MLTVYSSLLNISRESMTFSQKAAIHCSDRARFVCQQLLDIVAYLE
jgi:hypothetical protein